VRLKPTDIQGDSVARSPNILSINSLRLLATESPCIIKPNFIPQKFKVITAIFAWDVGRRGACQDAGSEGQTKVQEHSVHTRQSVAINM